MSNKESTPSKKERILESALKLFSLKGFHATTTKEIANECGVAEGLIFYYFGDKRKLLLEIVRNFTFLLRIQDEEKHLSQLPLEEALVQYGLKYLQFLKEHIDYIMLIWSPEMIQDEEVSQEVLKLIKNIGSAGGIMLKHGMIEVQRNEGTYETAMTMITSSILVYFMIHSRYGHDALILDDESYIRELVHLLLHGLIKQP